ncbi:MAG: hypothetical protein AUI50_06125 [Crenarchaeota archaeon 13_1_40CM_2_52_14]|nr:MAG: hypothetical protein AUI97_08715 [Crenarchaeota archaeon 13_1_40CM_3_52_17]OLD34530.1 MAG: hypothetical protein AUI50_06125 [Crenarchaeota archaeon 13_1_40CM_2_52_14]
MVPVAVSEKVPDVDEVKTPEARKFPVPEASSKRPVPPAIVQEPVIWRVFAEVGHKTSFDDVNTLSPFAAVKVSCSVAVDPPWHDAEPVMVLEAAKEVSPICSRTPEPVIVALVPDDVKVNVPEKLPLKGVEWDANTTGNAANTITARTVGIRTSLFIPM